MRSFKMLIMGFLIAVLVIGTTQGQASASFLPGVANLKAVVTDDGKIQLTWDPPFMMSASAIDHYNIEVKHGTNDKFYTDIHCPDCKCDYAPLDGQGVYWFSIQYEIGDSSSCFVNKSINYITPFPPKELKFSDIKWNGVTLTWKDDNASETAWIIDITGQDSNLAPLHEQIKLASNDHLSVEKFISSPLAPEGYYTFKVWAQTGGFISPAAQVSTHIPMCPPTQLTAKNWLWDTGPGVELAWQDNSHLEDGFEIERTNPDGSKNIIKVADATDSYPDQNLKYFSKYNYRIRAISTVPGMNSEWSDPISVTTPLMKVGDSAPYQNLIAPTGLQAEAKSSVRIDLTWKDRALTETGFAIERTGPDDSIAALVAPKNATSYSDTGLLPGSTYTYRVKAVKDSSSSEYSNTASATTLTYSPSAIQVLVNGGLLTMDVDPQIEQGRTLVPMRSIFEALGASVEWDGVAQKITAKRGDVTILLQIGSSQGFVNGKAVTLDAAPKISGGRTLVPMRFISEALGDEVKWDGSTRTASITSSFKKPAMDSSNIKPQTSDLTPVKMTYSLNLEPEAISLGSTDIVEFMGSLKASISGASNQSGLSGKTVTLYRVTDSGQRTQIGTATTGSGGSFEFKYKPSASGTYIAVYKNASGQDLAVSNESVVTVKSGLTVQPGTTIVPDLKDDNDDNNENDDNDDKIIINPKKIISLK